MGSEQNSLNTISLGVPGTTMRAFSELSDADRWGLAFVEYCLAVPANRFGSDVYSAAQLKTIQEVITLLVFAAFSVLYLKQGLTWNHLVGFALIAGGAYFIFRGPL